MSNDPFNIVKEELKKSINKTKSLIESYQAILNAKSRDEAGVDNAANNRLLGEIRTNLKSINWDNQDLEETIRIASKNPARFNLTNAEVKNRTKFVEQTKEFIQKTRQAFNIDFDDKISSSANSAQNKPQPNQNINIRIPDLISNAQTKTRGPLRSNEESDSDYDVSYSRAGTADAANKLDIDKPSNSSANLNQQRGENNDHHAIQMQHQKLFKEQDKTIDLISGRVSSLKDISQAMQNELDDQAELLDDMGREMDTADTKMNNTMKRIAKLMHMSSDRRQWTMIGILLLGIFILIILFAIL